MQITLSQVWGDYISTLIGKGAYSDADEVVRSALQLHQNQRNLREAVAIGAEQAERGEFVSQTLDEIFEEAEAEYSGQN